MIIGNHLKLIGEHFVLNTTAQAVNLAWAKLAEKATNKYVQYKTKDTRSITTTIHDDVFSWLSLWIYRRLENPQHTWAMTRWTDAMFRVETTRKIIYTPAPGRYTITVEYQQTLHTIVVYMNHDDGTKNSEAKTTLKLIDPKGIEGLLEFVIAEAEREFEEVLEKRPMIWTLNGFNWRRKSAVKYRDFNTVVLQKGVKQKLTDDIERFTAHRKLYETLGIPYKRGYLLYGPPGTGKTSLVRALAHKYNKDLYVGDLSGVTDRNLQQLFSEITPGSIVLFEDIDAAFPSAKRAAELVNKEDHEDNDEDTTAGGLVSLRREDNNIINEFTGKIYPSSGSEKQQRDSTLTLSGLLNALDGVSSPEDVMIFMTTNHPEYLDPALIRDGRIDLKVKLDYADREQAARLYKLAFPQASSQEVDTFSLKYEGVSPSRIVGTLLKLYR